MLVLAAPHTFTVLTYLCHAGTGYAAEVYCTHLPLSCWFWLRHTRLLYSPLSCWYWLRRTRLLYSLTFVMLVLAAPHTFTVLTFVMLVLAAPHTFTVLTYLCHVGPDCAAHPPRKSFREKQVDPTTVIKYLAGNDVSLVVNQEAGRGGDTRERRQLAGSKRQCVMFAPGHPSHAQCHAINNAAALYRQLRDPRNSRQIPKARNAGITAARQTRRDGCDTNKIIFQPIRRETSVTSTRRKSPARQDFRVENISNLIASRARLVCQAAIPATMVWYQGNIMTREVHVMCARDTALNFSRAVPEWRGGGGGGKREIPEKTLRPTASYGTFPTCENPVTRPGIEPGSPCCEASVLIGSISDAEVRYLLHCHYRTAGRLLHSVHFSVYRLFTVTNTGMKLKTKYRDSYKVGNRQDTRHSVGETLRRSGHSSYEYRGELQPHTPAKWPPVSQVNLCLKLKHSETKMVREKKKPSMHSRAFVERFYVQNVNNARERPVVQSASCTLHCLILAVVDFPSAGHFSRHTLSIAEIQPLILSSTRGPDAYHTTYTLLALTWRQQSIEMARKKTMFVLELASGLVQPRPFSYSVTCEARSREYGAAPELNGGGYGISPRKPADQRHCLARFRNAKIRSDPGRGLNPDRLGGRSFDCEVRVELIRKIWEALNKEVSRADEGEVIYDSGAVLECKGGGNGRSRECESTMAAHTAAGIPAKYRYRYRGEDLPLAEVELPGAQLDNEVLAPLSSPSNGAQRLSSYGKDQSCARLEPLLANGNPHVLVVPLGDPRYGSQHTRMSADSTSPSLDVFLVQCLDDKDLVHCVPSPTDYVLQQRRRSYSALGPKNQAFQSEKPIVMVTEKRRGTSAPVGVDLGRGWCAGEPDLGETLKCHGKEGGARDDL
ncbi:hypothetical protein PR048_027377 [Dryococelus australis]|uniref:Uncharacterized protein n=1 Tax=Dryococelus australis TaxID=614101 RepID=A0ABQ9GFB0_9NEOP|nr:hypothetical protein PR048_027377 [Dryococelus australis]